MMKSLRNHRKHFSHPAAGTDVLSELSADVHYSIEINIQNYFYHMKELEKLSNTKDLTLSFGHTAD